MKIQYVGARPNVSTVCSGRVSYYFGPENGYVCDVFDEKHAAELLKSALHKFVVIMEDKAAVIEDKVVVPAVEEKAVEDQVVKEKVKKPRAKRVKRSK